MFAIGCVWFAWSSLGDSVPGTLLAGIAALAAIGAAVESGRDLDSSPAAFQTFWVLLNAVILPTVFLSALLLILNSLIVHGRSAAFSALMLWLLVHLPFYCFWLPGLDSLMPWLTAVQWLVIALVTTRITRDWRVYEAIAMTFATILTVGVSIVIGLVTMGYQLRLEGP